MTKQTRHIDYHEWLREKLQDPETALNYLNNALMEDDQRVFLIALKNILESQGKDISALAEETDITRQNIYRMLSPKGNPRWNSLTSLFDALGLQFHVSFKKLDKQKTKKMAKKKTSIKKRIPRVHLPPVVEPAKDSRVSSKR